MNRTQPCRAYSLVSFDEPGNYDTAKKELENAFGKIDFESTSLYRLVPSLYDDKPRLLARIVSFERPIHREELVDIRNKALVLEEKFQNEGRPLFELDPGYVTETSVVHTTLEDDFHRIYLYHGIFGETLYVFERHALRPRPHTARFYRSPEVTQVFNDIRWILASGPS